MKRKKICFVVSTINSANAFLRNHIEALKKHYDVYIVANLKSDRDFEILSNIGFAGYANIKIVRKISLINDLRAIFKLFFYFRTIQFDAVHSLTPKAGAICQLAAKLSGTEVRIHIFTGQVWCNMRGFRKRLLVIIDKVIAKLATNILVDGNSQKEFLVANRVVCKKKAIVLGKGSIAGVNLNDFTFSQTIKQKQKIRFGIPEHVVVYSFLGRLNRDKGVPELLKAFSMLAKIRKDVFLILFGEDEENIEATFANYVELETGKNFLYAGFVSDANESIQVSDVFCLPSHREGFGVSIIEAEAMSIPVICSDAYGLKDTIVTGETGLRHKVGDVYSLFQTMLFMAEHPLKRIEFGKKGRNYVEENFSSIEITKHWVDYYHKILNDNV